MIMRVKTEVRNLEFEPHIPNFFYLVCIFSTDSFNRYLKIKNFSLSLLVSFTPTGTKEGLEPALKIIFLLVCRSHKNRSPRVLSLPSLDLSSLQPFFKLIYSLI